MKIIFNVVYSVILILCLAVSPAYSSTATENLKIQADELASLINNKKYTKVAFKINPLIVITMGGISQATDAIKYGFDALDSGGKKFKGIRFKQPDPIVTIDENLVAIVPSETLVLVQKDLYQVDSFYIAWSSDKGINWYFADGRGFDNLESLKFLFPNYNNELNLPKPKPPFKIKSALKVSAVF